MIGNDLDLFFNNGTMYINSFFSFFKKMSSVGTNKLRADDHRQDREVQRETER